MPYEQDVKELAYTLDPPAWVSYSGKPALFKAAMDDRRTASLKDAERTINRIKRKKAGQLNDMTLLAEEIQKLEMRAHQIGATVTGHALNNAKNALGWEMAGDPELAGMASRGERPG